MKIIPLFDRLVLKPIIETNTSSSIILPESAEKKPIMAEVVALGLGGTINGEKIDFKVQVGDKVLYNKFAGNEFKLDNEQFILIKQVDILAIIK